MSKLSELIPAGGSAKELSAVASGTLPNGRAVILKDNGQVEVVGLSAVSETIPLGSSSVFNTNQTRWNSVAFVSSNKFVLAFTNSSNYSTAIVGTVSGSSISFGTAVTILAASSNYLRVAADPNTAGKVVFAYSKGNQGAAKAGTVSGTSISLGSEAVFENAAMNYLSLAFDTLTPNRIAVAYRDDGNSDYGTCCVGVVSGLSISFGTPVVYVSADIQDPFVSFDSKTANKCVVSYTLQSNGYGRANVGTLSGTNSISFGSYSTFHSALIRPGNVSMSYNPNTANQFVVVYGENEDYGTAIVGTVSGTSISFATAVRFQSTAISYVSMAFDTSTVGKFVVAYRSEGNSYYGTTIVGTLSGTTPSFGSISTFQSSNLYDSTGVSFDSANAGKFLITYSNQANSRYGTAVLGQLAAQVTNLTSTNFVGFASEAISSGATGVINPVGGVAASVSNTPLLQVYGSEVIFNAGNVGWPTMDFDPNSAGKFVVCYRDTNGYGTAIVGTVSGNSITYGSEFVFEAAATNDICISFDPNTANKFLIAYQDAGSSLNGTAIVGTVSGTSLSFGSAVVFNSGDTSNIGLDCDPNTANKYVISYRNSANNNEGIALVGTVSGTSISFGSKVTFNSGTTGETSPAFDPNTTGKFVQTWINYSASNQSEACVGTVSGTSISFGSTVTFDTGGMNFNTIECDPNTAGKYVIAYTDVANSSFGTAIVGTVSGTSISFGTAVVYSSVTSGYNSIGFDPNNAGKCVIAYQDTPNSSSGTSVMGTVSGTSISFGSKVVFNGNSSYFKPVFDPNTAGKYVISYRDSNGHGASIVGNLSDALTIGSTYYVQGNGTVSTVSTSPAIILGKAVSSTSLILKGNS